MAGVLQRSCPLCILESRVHHSLPYSVPIPSSFQSLIGEWQLWTNVPSPDLASMDRFRLVVGHDGFDKTFGNTGSPRDAVQVRHMNFESTTWHYLPVHLTVALLWLCYSGDDNVQHARASLSPMRLCYRPPLPYALFLLLAGSQSLLPLVLRSLLSIVYSWFSSILKRTHPFQLRCAAPILL